MLQKKHNPYILFLLIICVLCSGMCLDLIDMMQVDFFFSYETTSQPFTFLDRIEEKALNEESCTVEMLGIGSSSCFVQNARISGIKTGTKLAFLLVSAVILICWTSQYRIAEYGGEHLSFRYKAAILKYIHNQDGKK